MKGYIALSMAAAIVVTGCGRVRPDEDLFQGRPISDPEGLEEPAGRPESGRSESCRGDRQSAVGFRPVQGPPP